MIESSKHAVKAVLSLALLILPVIAQTQTIRGKVTVVAEGDTLTVLDGSNRQHNIRLIGIDAPELNQAFGEKAKKSLSDLVYGKTVTVTGSKTDRDLYILGKVMLGARDINLEQIRRGFAWFYRRYATELSRDDARAYESAEDDARARERGLWADPGPIPPWELRAAQRSEPAADDSPPQQSGQIIGNRNLMIYHKPGCPDYNRVADRNRVLFRTEEEAARAGYRKARNCP
jgi:endonuclease YncB( thermonuclease family)